MDSYIKLNMHPDYEIMENYPHNIRRIKDKNDCVKWFNNKGYEVVKLEKIYLKHRIIAEQFLLNDNPEKKTEINHINHNRADNQITNLEWCSRSENMFDRSQYNGIKYKFVDELPDDAVSISQYETRTEMHEFTENRYWYSSSTKLFYFNNKRNYKILNIKESNGYKQVCLVDTNKKFINVSLISFKRQYGI
ncbi:hypothetical protein M9Y10_021718 [Tritrichomonas musculus]|uniref:HNH nuclease domain-containing protein n=1 Tax=Tritrichomonas musculus TaxID=1915356 RepID=A0ABR2KRC1_9EUKA